MENAKNQWFRGPAKPMATDKLQETIDSYLKISGNDGKFKITVAREGMLLTNANIGSTSDTLGTEVSLNQNQNKSEHPSSQSNNPQGSNMVELEALQKYVIKIEKDDKENKLKLTIEDKINRYDLRFVHPHKEPAKDTAKAGGKENYILKAEGEKGMLAKGPALYMETHPIILNDSADKEAFGVRVRAYKGKKDVFNDEMIFAKINGMKLNKFIEENF